MDPTLTDLAHHVARSRDLESLTRPMLELLKQVTGLEATYLTAIDLEESVQRVIFSTCSGKLEIPENLSVPWGDTLCKRALDEGRVFTDEVDQVWGDSDAARELGINTYLSRPL